MTEAFGEMISAGHAADITVFFKQYIEENVDIPEERFCKLM